MIYKTDNGYFVISSNKVWMPGVYDSRKAARYAFKFPDFILSELQERVGHKEISFELLQRARKKYISIGFHEDQRKSWDWQMHKKAGSPKGLMGYIYPP